MPLSKEDAPSAKPKKAVEPEEVAGTEAEHEPRSEEHPGNLTPSMYALQEVGPFEGEPGSPEAGEHGEKYLSAKMKHRLGY